MKNHKLTLSLAAAALVVFGSLSILRDSWDSVAGDEGTYLAMASSLAFDGDLKFEGVDLARLEAGRGGGRDTLILQSTDRGVTFSKPILFPLVAAPFYRVLGEQGLVLLNIVVLSLALWLASGYLERRNTSAEATLLLATFVGVSVVFPYVAWKTFDLFQVALSLAGLVLCLGVIRPATQDDSLGRARRVVEHMYAPWCGAILLGLLISIRYPNALLLVAVVIILLSVGKIKRALGVAIFALAVIGMILFLTSILSGDLNPYRAKRASFNVTEGDSHDSVGLVDPFDLLESKTRLDAYFESNKATSTLGAVPQINPRVSLYSALYFFAGRHTGIILYFPAALLFGFYALRYVDRMGVILLLAVGGSVIFYLLWLPHNYFGGAGFLGNRYFLSVYPALLLAPMRLPSRKAMAGVWIVGVLVALSALASVVQTHGLDGSSQNHAYAGIFRYVPYESTASDLDGSRDRFWANEMTRFVDPYVQLKAKNFYLSTDTPATEIEIAHLRKQAGMRFWVSSQAEELELVYSDRGGTRTIPLLGTGGINQVIEIEPASSWRYHPLWFRNVWDHGLPYYARTYRLQLRAPNGQKAKAAFRYLGNESLPTYLFGSRVLQAEVPTEVIAGSRSSVPLRVQNLGSDNWVSNSDLPVFLSYRIGRRGPGEEEWRDGPRYRLGQLVPPQGILDRELEIEWPQESGVYHLEIDLILAEVTWFADQTGAPIFDGEVRIFE